MFLELRECKARSNSVSEGSKYLLTPTSYDVSVKSINCVCARTNKQFILIDTPNTENEIKWCEHAILWEFEVFEDCGNCIAMEQSGYISEWQNLLLTLTSFWYQGQKVINPMQACLQEDFWTWDPPKTWVRSHFLKKNERITNVFRIARVQST